MKRFFSLTRGRSVLLLLAAILLLPTPHAVASPGIVAEDLTGPLDAAALVNALLGSDSGATVSNVTFTGPESAAGTFSGATGILAFDGGVILSSGRVVDVAGPNSSDSTSTSFLTPGDPDLDGLIPGYTTWDAAVLEFDFDCQGVPNVSFEYVFASEEYNEYTNSPFNNVFGFFLDGTNIALLPDGVTPVSINNVNGGYRQYAGWGDCYNGIDDDADGLTDFADPDCTTPNDNIVGEANSNSTYFINNDCSDSDFGTPCPINIEADGMTVSLPAYSGIGSGPHHIKLAIADAGDSRLDSWVLLKGGSFQCGLPGGFVTGGGWIYSEPGSYRPDPLLEGRANFGFVSKYKRGAERPTGQTQFHFQAADFNFHSGAYDMLVVTRGGTYAQYKGTGTINGVGEYKFMLWAGDEEPDTFRIKIWEEANGNETVIYDNGFDQAIGGGSIVVHRE